MSGYLSGLLSGGSSQAGTTAPQIQAAGATSATPAAAAPAAPVGGLGQFGQGFVQGLQGVGGSGALAGAGMGGGLPWQNTLGQALGGLVGARQPVLQGLAQQFGPQPQMPSGQSPTPTPTMPQFGFGNQFSLLRGFPQLQGMLQNYNGFY